MAVILSPRTLFRADCALFNLAMQQAKTQDDFSQLHQKIIQLDQTLSEIKKNNRYSPRYSDDLAKEYQSCAKKLNDLVASQLHPDENVSYDEGMKLAPGGLIQEYTELMRQQKNDLLLANSSSSDPHVFNRLRHTHFEIGKILSRLIHNPPLWQKYWSAHDRMSQEIKQLFEAKGIDFAGAIEIDQEDNDGVEEKDDEGLTLPRSQQIDRADDLDNLDEESPT